MTATTETVVAGGRVMLPGADPHAPAQADLLIRGDRIAAVGAPGEFPIAAGNRVIDASGLLVSPGFVNAPGGLRWALSPSGPQRSSRALLEGIADLSRRYALPVLTHVYETKAQAAKARALYIAQDGSMLRWLEEVGLLNERLTIVHGVWLSDAEVGLLAKAGAGLAHNPASNLKLKSGLAPMRRVIDAGVNVSLGCDNCSCGDCQNMFTAMKLLCLLAAAADPNPTGVHAADAWRAATLGGAKAVGLEGETGTIAPGMFADLVMLDLADIAYVPLNSAVRQLVFAESGRGVHSVMISGQLMLHAGRIITVDEAELRREAAELMPQFRRDHQAQAARAAEATPWLLEANRRVAAEPLGLDRYLPG